MITHIKSINVYVLDLERALSFYIDKLGFLIHTEIEMDTCQRMVTVYLPQSPDYQLMLIPVEEGMLFKKEQARLMRALIKEEFFSYGVFQCKDLVSTYQDLKEKGVHFIMAPGEGFLNQYEAAFIDDSGNWFRLTQDHEAV